jgi:Fe2+ or Zn2+ uptake regulation protein
MDWLESSLKLLKKDHDNKPFSVEEAATTLEKEKGYTKNTVYLVLHELNKRGSLTRLGRGVYQIRVLNAHVDLHAHFTLSDKTSIEVATGALSKATEALNEKGIEFMVTGPSLLTRFHHYLSWRYLHLIYVVKGGGEYSVKALRDAGFPALSNPKRKEIETILENTEGKDLFIVREFADLEGNVNGKASLERALVDTYFEVTRGKIPFAEVEAGRIIANAFRDEKIDVTRLLYLAGRRGVRDEFKAVIKEVIPDFPIYSSDSNKHVKNVLHGIRE